jgi:hypothetical protein
MYGGALQHLAFDLREFDTSSTVFRFTPEPLLPPDPVRRNRDYPDRRDRRHEPDVRRHTPDDLPV